MSDEDVKKYIKDNGKTELSKFIRKIVVLYLGKNRKLDYLLSERKKLSKEIVTFIDSRREIDDQLRENGLNPDLDL